MIFRAKQSLRAASHVEKNHSDAQEHHKTVFAMKKEGILTSLIAKPFNELITLYIFINSPIKRLKQEVL